MNIPDFWTPFLSAVSSFLLSSPINAFVGIMVLCFIVSLFFRIIGVNR